MLRASAPLRVDLAGGTLDIYPLYLLQGGSLTVNAAISRYARAELETRANGEIRLIAEDLGQEERFPSLEELDLEGELGLVKRLIKYYEPGVGFELRTCVESPAGSGLGGSSALALAVSSLLGKVTGKDCGLAELIRLARDLEAQALGIPTGVQDYYAAAYGGMNAIWLEPGGERRERLALSAEFVEELEERLILGYTGIAHRSGQLNWQVFKRYIDGDPRAREGLGRIKETALRMREALVAEDFEELGQALRAEWEARRLLASGITTAKVDRLIELALRSGARGAKLCGAAGGGALLLLAGERAKTRVERALREEGVELLKFGFSLRGLEVAGF